MRMRAWRSHRPGGPSQLTLDEVPVPRPGPGEILVKVSAVGLNFPDGLLIRDLYQVKPPRPLVPGSEFCGVIEDTGSEVTCYTPGDVVVGACGWGALAEYIVQPEQRLFRVPAGIPAQEAAAFLFTYATAFHALHDISRIRPGETLFVLGAAGGVGSAAVAVGNALGANVVAGASTQAKLDFALKRGSHAGVVYPPNLEAGGGQRFFARQLKTLAPKGIDVAVDPVGGAYTEPVIRSLARNGRHLIVGFAAGIPVVPLNVTLLRSCHISGVDWRTFIEQEPMKNADNIEKLFDLWRQQRIAPAITEVFAFDDAPSALARLEVRDVLGKVVVAT